MYFLSVEENRLLLRQLVPQMRETGVAEELRGWTWPEPPVAPPYDARLALYEIAGKYCPSGRDVYLRHSGIKSQVSSQAFAGSAYHDAVVQVLMEAKRLIYVHGPGRPDEIMEGIRSFQPKVEGLGSAGQEGERLAQGVDKIKRFEDSRVVARLKEVLSRQPHINADSLAATVIPLVCEHRLDGSFLGLSSLLSCDAAFQGGAVVFDLKFGHKRDFHRLSATGYAMVMESLWEFPVDIGCTVYVDLRGPVPSVSRELFQINDELRQWFIDERDDKMRIVAEELDPGVPDNCYQYCGYRHICLSAGDITAG